MSFPRQKADPAGPTWARTDRSGFPEFGAGKLARFDPASAEFEEYPFPVKDAGPYVVRVDQTRGTVWVGTGHGDVMASFDPVTEAFTLYPLPTRGALIRHLDIDERSGEVWAAYGASPGPPAKILRIRPPGA